MPEKIATGVSSFRGVDRRFQIRGQARGVTVVDDYGHHPTEIRATLAAAREYCPGRIHVVFQPHRFTRTRDLLDEFGGAFGDADSVVVLPIYAASEEPLPGITAELLTSKITKPVAHLAPDFSEAVAAVAGAAREGDMILTLGAGSVSQLGPQILSALDSTP
jgi:UDP-N-acetylmuramate--alanine ligase